MIKHADIAHESEPSGLTVDGTLRELELEFSDDPVVACFKQDVDRSLLIDNLFRTYDERARRMNEFLRARDQLQAARRPH
ncbi:MAG: hypothetical protein KJ072_20050 [Verrucomicrobia bacterium]|nr:hypothetical protein [Verrucomicrobiota bacterium]